MISEATVDPSAPAVSVLLATHGRPTTLARALDSMAAQTLDPGRYEVVVIVNGPPGESVSVVRSFARSHPELGIRLLESTRAGVAHARTVGLRAARGDYMTILDDDDWVSPQFLEQLVDGIAPGVIPLAWMADLHDGAEDDPRFDNYFSTKLASRTPGELVPALQMRQALSLNVCKLVPVSLAREVGYDEDLRGGSDFVFWTAVYARQPFAFRIPRSREAVYYRTRGHGSLSRQDLGFDFNVEQRLACIASLERLHPSTRDGERMVARMITAQSAFVNRFLEAHPDERGRVEAAAAQHGVKRLSLDRP